MKKVLAILQKLEAALCITMFLIMTGCCILQVLNRNIFKISSISWTEELARFSMIWMALLGSEMGLRYGKQMSVEAVVNKLPRTVKKFVEVIGDLVCAIFAGVAGWFSIPFLKTAIDSNQISTAMKLPMWIVYLILPTVLFAMCGYEIYHIWEDWTGKSEEKNAEGGETS